MPPTTSITRLRNADPAGYVDLGARVTWEDAGSSTLRSPAGSAERTYCELANATPAGNDGSIARLHADWLAGTPSGPAIAPGGEPR